MQSRTDYACLVRHGAPVEALLSFGNDTNLDGMAAEPVYVKVPDGKRPLRVTAHAKSRRHQLVRISAAEVPSKMSRVWWFDDRELRPGHDEKLELDLPAVGLKSFGVRAARGVNRVIGRTGTVWAERHHRRELGSSREVRDALSYMLSNGEPPSEPLPVTQPETWLLRAGWLFDAPDHTEVPPPS